ncbi:MAG: FAD-dependent oxidoreductase, partial [Acaryochloridaceae cyanobacterium RL_2_7]|nr:FAD-dependent oxidoreductase [Acaryochloridaceae cyanobacterium RL_2_7]
MIIGAGFAGLQTAVSLKKADADVCLIDRNAYHTFVPLLYQVATATLLPEQIAFPVRSLCRRQANLRFLHTEVQKIDLDQRQIYTPKQALSYDYLVLATGSQLKFFGVKGGEIPHFDIILLGMGDDGHTASLFPHTEVLQVCDRLVAVGSKSGQPRLTFTIPLINHGRCVIFLAAG